MFSLPGLTGSFRPSWRLSVVSGLAAVFLCYLGFWQLYRAEEKIKIINLAAVAVNQPAKPWTHEQASPEPYQTLRLQGRFLGKVILLDNQHHEHQFGYHVLSPLVLKNDKVVLVDRGWILGSPERQRLPEVKALDAVRTIVGSAYYPSSKQWVLGQPIEKRGPNLVVVEALDLPMIAGFLHKSVYPFIIRLNKGEADAYLCEWPLLSMPPERHRAYAVQWFLLACVVLILFLKMSYEKST